MIDLTTLFATAAALFNVAEETMITAQRGNDRLIQARQAIALVLAERAYTTTEIGEILRRDASTAGNAIRQARRRLTSDPAFAARVRLLAATLDPMPPPPPPPTTAAKRRDAWVIENSVHIALFFWGGILEPATA